MNLYKRKTDPAKQEYLASPDFFAAVNRNCFKTKCYENFKKLLHSMNNFVKIVWI